MQACGGRGLPKGDFAPAGNTTSNEKNTLAEAGTRLAGAPSPRIACPRLVPYHLTATVGKSYASGPCGADIPVCQMARTVRAEMSAPRSRHWLATRQIRTL